MCSDFQKREIQIKIMNIYHKICFCTIHMLQSGNKDFFTTFYCLVIMKCFHFKTIWEIIKNR